MIRVYDLPVIVIDDAETVAGIEFIHHSLLACTEQPLVRKLIQDTTPLEHDGLVAVALEWREAYKIEIALLNSLDFPLPLPGFTPLNPIEGIPFRLDHVEAWLKATFPPAP